MVLVRSPGRAGGGQFDRWPVDRRRATGRQAGPPARQPVKVGPGRDVAGARRGAAGSLADGRPGVCTGTCTSLARPLSSPLHSSHPAPLPPLLAVPSPSPPLFAFATTGRERGRAPAPTLPSTANLHACAPPLPLIGSCPHRGRSVVRRARARPDLPPSHLRTLSRLQRPPPNVLTPARADASILSHTDAELTPQPRTLPDASLSSRRLPPPHDPPPLLPPTQGPPGQPHLCVRPPLPPWPLSLPFPSQPIPSRPSSRRPSATRPSSPPAGRSSLLLLLLPLAFQRSGPGMEPNPRLLLRPVSFPSRLLPAGVA